MNEKVDRCLGLVLKLWVLALLRVGGGIGAEMINTVIVVVVVVVAIVFVR